MDQIISSPIFILITGLSQILIVIFGAIVLGYLVNIVRNLNSITKIAKKEVDTIVADIENARSDIKKGVEMTRKQIKIISSALTVQRAFGIMMDGISKVSAGRKKKIIKNKKKVSRNK